MLARHVKLSRTSTQADVGTDFPNFSVDSLIYDIYMYLICIDNLGNPGEVVTLWIQSRFNAM